MAFSRYSSDSDTQNHASTDPVARAYRQKSVAYNAQLKLFSLFARLGFDIAGWRTVAITELNLQPGDTVVDIGCGTGLNFSQLHAAVGPQGRIIAVDLSPEMLQQADKLVQQQGWQNIELVCAAAETYQPLQGIAAVISVYTFILTTDPDAIITKLHQALRPGGRMVILDMAWPRWCPLWWRHVLFFLKSYGVSLTVLQARRWQAVRRRSSELFPGCQQRRYWMGFFYRICATRSD